MSSDHGSGRRDLTPTHAPCSWISLLLPGDASLRGLEPLRGFPGRFAGPQPWEGRVLVTREGNPKTSTDPPRPNTNGDQLTCKPDSSLVQGDNPSFEAASPGSVKWEVGDRRVSLPYLLPYFGSADPNVGGRVSCVTSHDYEQSTSSSHTESQVIMACEGDDWRDNTLWSR